MYNNTKRSIKGFSLIGLLLAVLIIGILIKLMLPQYKQAVAPQQTQGQPHVRTQSQAKQTVDNVRAALKSAEQAAQRRAEFNPDN